MNTDQRETEAAGGVVIIGGVLFGLGVAMWLFMVPTTVLSGIFNQVAGPVTNGFLLFWLVGYVVLSGIGTMLITMRLSLQRAAPRVVLTVFLVLLVIGIVGRIWLGTLPEHLPLPPLSPPD